MASTYAAPYGGAFFAPSGSFAVGSPPWQSTQPTRASATCMSGSSTMPGPGLLGAMTWQLRQPALFAAACSFVCVAGLIGSAAGGGDAQPPSARSTTSAIRIAVIVASIRQRELGENRVQGVALLVEVREARPGKESRRPHRDHEVVVQHRTPQ